jgi:GH25 family lysozyme M1 (1,4-beta-N-acetylmuramidase)
MPITPIKEEAMIRTTIAKDGTVYRITDLEEAFRKACDPDDWKAPIEAWCRPVEAPAICEAIRFYTATEPKVELDTARMRYRITSEGYCAGPAGDH